MCFQLLFNSNSVFCSKMTMFQMVKFVKRFVTLYGLVFHLIYFGILSACSTIPLKWNDTVKCITFLCNLCCTDGFWSSDLKSFATWPCARHFWLPVSQIKCMLDFSRPCARLHWILWKLLHVWLLLYFSKPSLSLFSAEQPFNNWFGLVSLEHDCRRHCWMI